MTVVSNNIPESWLALLGGRDASGWLASFVESPKQAVADLLWDTFYFGPLNLTERGQLLAGWLDRLGNIDQFAERLDAELTDWVEENWGHFDQSAEPLASAWTCLCRVVEFSSMLPEDSHLKDCAAALRARFDGRQRFLGSFSSAPAADPLGSYLAVVAEFQGQDRSLAAFWHRMCYLPDGVPFYHARYAMLGLRRLKAADSSENGILRAEVVHGLMRLARAFDRLERGRGIPEHIAKATFRRVAAQTAAAYPNSPRWRDLGLTEVLELPERAQRWLLEAVPPLAEAMRREKNKTAYNQLHPHKSIRPNLNWPQRSQDLASRLKNGDRSALPEAKLLLYEERRYAEATGDTYDIVHSLRNLASRILHFAPWLALRWAEEALKWAPHDPYSWNTVTKTLLYQGNLNQALAFAWVAWKRFPEDVVTHTSLAEVLKGADLYNEAEVVYHLTIERFPNNPFAYTGLAEVLKDSHRYHEAAVIYRQARNRFGNDVRIRNGLADVLRRMKLWNEAEDEYRSIIKDGNVNEVTFTGLAYLVVRKGELGRVEALYLINQALKLAPRSSYALKLKQKLAPDSGMNHDELIRMWEEDADGLADASTLRASESEEWDSEQDAVQPTTIEHHPPVPQPETSEGERQSAHGNEDIPDSGVKAPVSNIDQPTPPEAEPAARTSGTKSQQFTLFDSLKIGALVAEAYFYRMWARRIDGKTASVRRQKAAILINQAEQLAPQDPQVLAERAALMVDKGNKLTAYNDLMIHIASHPAAIPLLVLKARLDRDRAQKENRLLNNATLAELCAIPQRLRDLDSTLAPLFQFQKGLAALALLDGAVRKQTAADAFSGFRRMLAHRAVVEKKEREQARDRHTRETPLFHEWLQGQVNTQVFVGLGRSEDVEIRADEIPLLEDTWKQHPAVFEEVEDMFADRLTFRTI